MNLLIFYLLELTLSYKRPEHLNSIDALLLSAQGPL